MIQTPEQVSAEMRQEAKNILYRLFNLPEGFSSTEIDNFVDLIVGVSVLECSLVMKREVDKIKNGTGIS
jgi:hypothetical protein